MRVTHGACGRTWDQRGNRSGHCGSCHRTFYGLTAFDRHFLRAEDGSPVCIDPVTGPRGPWWQDDDGQWHHGPRMSAEIRERMKAASVS